MNWSEIDRGIRPLVRFLNRNGVTTTSSCQGHKNKPISLFPTQPWVQISRVSFKENAKFLDACLHKPDGESFGRLFSELINPGLLGFKQYYFVVFWNKECVTKFIKRFKELQ